MANNEETVAGILQLVGCGLVIAGAAVQWGGGAALITAGFFLILIEGQIRKQ